MDDILPWIGYLAAYVMGGLAGFFGAAMFCGSAQSELRAENEALRDQLKALEEGRLPEEAQQARHYGCSEGLAA
jgi:hypothetical protein